MREIFTSGSVGRASGEWCIYPEQPTGLASGNLQMILVGELIGS